MKAEDEAEFKRRKKLIEKMWECQHDAQPKDDRSSLTACCDEGGIDTTNTEDVDHKMDGSREIDTLLGKHRPFGGCTLRSKQLSCGTIRNEG